MYEFPSWSLETRGDWSVGNRKNIAICHKINTHINYQLKYKQKGKLWVEADTKFMNQLIHIL